MNEVFRQEKKFLITKEQFYRYSHNLSQVMQMDSHSGSEGYLIRSLYFDSLDDRDFWEKEDGIELRRKIRLRNYGPDSDFAKLEMKRKQGAMQKKTSLVLKKEDAIRLSKGEYSVLLSYPEEFAAECFYVLNQYCYRPKTVVSYQRKAFVAKENDIRITFDYNIRGTESNHDIFLRDLVENDILSPALVVLEVKYNGFLLSYIKDMINQCDSSETSVSKYCLGRSISKHYTF